MAAGAQGSEGEQETIVSARLDDSARFAIDTVDLHHAPNLAREDPTESSFDRDAAVLLASLRAVLARHAATRVVVALDAPLEAKARAGQPPRRRAVGKGEKTGSKRRQAEDHLQQHMGGLEEPQRSAWNPGLKIQAGSPVPPRISAIVKALGEQGYRAYRGGDAPQRALLEVFPSEAIWSLGIAGHYGSRTASQVRAYKDKKSLTLTLQQALEIAKAPLIGFVSVLARTELGEARAQAWVDTLARHACEVSRRKDGQVAKGKRFEDVIDSGSAFLTAVAFALHDAHVWGDGTDGVIVGPGRLELVAPPPSPRPPLPITIRPALDLDMDALLELQAEIHALHVQAEPHRYRLAAPQVVRAHFEALLEDPDAQILVAADDGALLGYLVAKQERREHPMITPQSFVLVDALSVSAKARRRGVGRRLMDAAMAHAQALGTEAVELAVRSFNREAIAFYEALGFVTGS